MLREARRLVSVVAVLQPRLLQLEAFFTALCGATSSAAFIAARCAALAIKMGNTLESSWAELNRKVSGDQIKKKRKKEKDSAMCFKIHVFQAQTQIVGCSRG